MVDTQWPRFEVFVQERPGAPYQDAGSVHAPDSEMALFNARDVFARRPEVANLWVVPASEIYSRTQEELQFEAATAGRSENAPTQPLTPTVVDYLVFCKTKSAGALTLTGETQAASPAEALAKFANRAEFIAQPPFAWWVIPKRAMNTGDPANYETFYAPALDKPFRLSTDFKTHTAMRRIHEGDTSHE